jgi:hypothetical protein
MERRARIAAALLGWILCGCGYHVNNLAPALRLRTIAIPTLKNRTSTFQVEQRLTRALIEEFSSRGHFRVTSSEDGADAAVLGEITALSSAPVIIGRASFGSTFLVTLNARVRLVDLKSGKVLFRNDNYVFREQYVINADVKEFFSEVNPALERVARDFAKSVLASVLTGN